jgi:parallel beta-helix repeat protein
VSGIHIHDVGQEGLAIRAGATGTAPRNFTVTNSEIDHTGRRGTSSNGEGIYLGNSSGTDTTNGVIVSNNTIHDTQDECIELKGDSHDNIIDGNTLYNCLSPGSAFGNTGGAIEIDEPRNTNTNPNQIIRNNIIHDIAFTSGITKRGIRAGTGATIYNNILYNINSSYSCILSNSANFPRLIYHNTVDCTTANAIVNSGTTMDSRNNIGPATSGNLAFNSGYFVNAAAHDYHLVAGSAPINAGVDLTAVVAVDKDGNNRLIGSAPDDGAYEFGATSGAPSAPQNLRITITP